MEELVIFSCKYVGELSERSSKKKQFDIAKKVLREDFKDGAVFVFYDGIGKFRFSFIRKHYGKEKKKYTNWKRYTYFIDPNNTNKTFKQRVGACPFSSLDEILDAFSVEPLNKEFYQGIVRQFYSLVGGEVGAGRNKEKLSAHLVLPGGVTDRNIVRQFGVRLVGRIIFCWFLKHKSSKQGVPLIPDDWLSSKNIGKDYYHGKLEKLFFEILNKKHDDRAKMLPDDHEVIPFLNGGLFEPQRGKHKDYYDSQPNYALKISDVWFIQLFEVLEQYNFTIDENSVNDAEVSIDPEMLGRIFENLLAEIDPNLKGSEKTSVRRATGSYYTPREIVDYMVEEALVKYLHNETDLDQNRLHSLFIDAEDEERSFSPSESESLITAFDQVKILDPAAGSGAFPMGALHKIVTALEKLDPGAKRWKEKQLEAISNAAIKAEMNSLLARSNAEYARKLGVLQKCIYGADIQPIAAEISKLRSFLSLIVDEDIDDNRENRGIIALPNLEFKFVTANTLIGLSNTGELETKKVSDLMPQLQRIRLDYLQSHGDEKAELKKDFKHLQDTIFKDQMKINPDMESRPMQLASWNPFRNEETNWFDPEWMFGVKQFDIVLGNPPYGGKKISNNLKEILGLGSKDPYGAFIAKYLRKSEDKTPLKHLGILAFIISDTFMTIKSHRELRNFILENRIHSMIGVHPDTFNATVNTVISIFERQENKSNDQWNVLMANFSNIPATENHEKFIDLLRAITDYKHPDYNGEFLVKDDRYYMKGSDWSLEVNSEFAIYQYPQNLVSKNHNKPIFFASPKLYGLMNDRSSQKIAMHLGNKNSIRGRSILLNNKVVKGAKFKEIADVKRGIDTGKNDDYLYQVPDARGNYRSIDELKHKVFTRKELMNICANEQQRKNIIKKGFNPHAGKYIIPFDKGGQSNSQKGWMPNYYVPSEYFLDWSEKSVKSLYERATFSTAKANLRNPDYWFREGISFSARGVYSPTFRLNSVSVFDSNGSSVYLKGSKVEPILGLLTSKIFKYLLKNYCGHTSATEVDELKNFFVNFKWNDDIKYLVKSIIKKQEEDLNYDYASNEQLQIEYISYQSYGLSWQDVVVVENWHERRYPKLVNAQKSNLAKLGKPTDYIEIYKSFIDKYGDLAG